MKEGDVSIRRHIPFLRSLLAYTLFSILKNGVISGSDSDIICDSRLFNLLKHECLLCV